MLLAALTSCALWCQQAFDVASIKAAALARAGGEGSLKESLEVSPLSLTMRNVSLSYCMEWAYRVKDYQISGASWIGSERWDIFARTGSPIAEEQLRLMLRTLLADRFHLVFHRDRKELPVYALLKGKSEPRLRESPAGSPSSMTLVRPGLRLAFRYKSMSNLADTLSTLLVIGRPVLDETGIDGFYDFTLDLRELRLPDAPEPGPSPSSVLSEQLGLRLESRKAPLEICVIDHAERIPIAN